MGSFIFSEKYILCRLALKVSPQVIGRLKTSSIAEHKSRLQLYYIKQAKANTVLEFPFVEKNEQAQGAQSCTAAFLPIFASGSGAG